MGEEVDIYAMKLHESRPIGTKLSILRVAGGWVYGTMQGCCFVPFDNEFQPRKAAADPCPYDAIVSDYQRICVAAGWPDIRGLGDKRKRKMRKLWQTDLPHITDWISYFEDAASKPFLLGQNDRGWKGNLDFLLRQETVIKMQEGAYDPR